MNNDLNFWTYSDDIPNDVGFEQFSFVHIKWLVLIVLLTFFIVRCFKRLPEKYKDIMLKTTGSFLVFLIVLRIVVLCMGNNMSVYELPLHLCSLAGFLCMAHAFLKWDFLGQVIYSLCLPGTVLALVFPDWSYYPAFNFITVQAFLFHGGIVLYTIMALSGGKIKPSVYKMWKAILFLVIIVPVIYLFDRHYDVNYMFVLRPSADSPLEWIDKTMGRSGYLIGYAILTIMVVTLMNVLYGAIHGFKRTDNDN